MKGKDVKLKQKKEKKKFKLFDMNRDGKGVYEEEDRKPTLLFFFKLLWRKFSQLIRLNFLMLFQIIPIIAFIYVYFAGTKTPVSINVLYAPLYGISQILPSSSLTSILDTQGIQMGIPTLQPAVMITLLVLGLLLAITFGWQNVGAAYVLRGLVRGDPVFIWSDFFYAIKRNLKQAFFMGLIDFACIVVLIFDYMFFASSTGTFGNDLMYFATIALIIIYFIMRFYIYVMLVTFDIKNFKILKNAFIFSILGIMRNLVAVVGIVLLAIVHVFVIVMSLSVGFTVPLILPLFYAMALLGFISVYAAYPVIDKYMIAPQLAKAAQDNVESYEEDNVEDVSE